MVDSCTLAFAGDVMLGRHVNDTLARTGPAYPWGNVLSVRQEADLFLINLECALTARTERWQGDQRKPFFFRAEPALGETLKIAGVDFASLANNHIGDFDAPGLLETLEVLDRLGIAHAGAGPDLAAARAPARLDVRGWRIGVLAFSDHPRAWAATPASPGLNYSPVSVAPDDFAAVEGALAEARREADLVIFSIHWGPNMRSRPTAAFREFARKVIEAGADIFWGHSAHVVQGIEFWQDKLILFDTGDFLDDYRVDEALRNDLSALFLVQVRPPAIERLELVPVKIGQRQVNLVRGPEREWFVQRLTTLCAEMGTHVQAGPDEVRIPTPSQRQP